ncbi:MAG TPA: hypothetical protein VGK18_01585 [Propionicimonas sp.]|uniref:hypothetical protein n=1 Tax=Propionicimonas sp. TaxID=1955623 RepID=UPI002F420B52
MTQPPVRYENYPPDDGAGPDESEPGHGPIVRPYLPEQLPPPVSGGRGTGRRSLIGLAIGIPVVLIGFANTRSSGNSTWVPMPGGPMDEPSSEDPSTEDPVEEAPGQTISVGSHSAAVPAGWSVSDDGSTVEVTNGTNRLTAVSFDPGTSTRAVDEIAHLGKRHYAGFAGKIGDAVDRSSAVLQHATMDGRGTFRGLPARLMVELWIDEAGIGLLVTRVLTAKVASAIAVEAQQMVDELGRAF